MKLRRRRKAQKTAVDRTLQLQTADGRVITNFSGQVMDNLRHMFTRIQYKESLPKKMALTSAIREEGVTYISWALGKALAKDLQKSVCVVELNWWSPNKMLQFGASTGLAGVLNGESTLNEAIIPMNDPNLSLLPAGQMPMIDRTVMARSQPLAEVIDQVSEQFDYVLLDVPAVRMTSDAIPLATIGDACSLVVRQGVTNVADVRMALDDIAHLSILGVILNQVSLSTPDYISRLIPQA